MPKQTAVGGRHQSFMANELLILMFAFNKHFPNRHTHTHAHIYTHTGKAGQHAARFKLSRNEKKTRENRCEYSFLIDLWHVDFAFILIETIRDMT